MRKNTVPVTMSLSVRVGAPHVLSELPKTCHLSEALQIATLKPNMMAHMRKGEDTSVKYTEIDPTDYTRKELEGEIKELETEITNWKRKKGDVFEAKKRRLRAYKRALENKKNYEKDGVDHTEYTRKKLDEEIEELETEIANWNRKKGEVFEEKKRKLRAYKKALKKKEQNAAVGPLGKIMAGVRKDAGRKSRINNKALRQQRRDWKLNRSTAAGAKDNTDRWLIEQNRLREKYGYPPLVENDLELKGREDRGELSSDDSDDEEDLFQEQQRADGMDQAGPSGTSPPEGGQQLDPVAVMEDDEEFDFDDDVLGPGGEDQAIPAQASLEGDVLFLAGSEEIDVDDDDSEAAAAVLADLASDSDDDDPYPFGTK